MRVECVRTAETRAQIVRVLHAVEDEQERRLGEMIQLIFQRHVGQLCIDQCHHSLMLLMATGYARTRPVPAQVPIS